MVTYKDIPLLLIYNIDKPAISPKYGNGTNHYSITLPETNSLMSLGRDERNNKALDTFIYNDELYVDNH